MKYTLFVFVLLIELMLTACGSGPLVDVSPTVVVASPTPDDIVSQVPARTLPTGVTITSKVKCTGQDVGYQPDINITFAYQVITYSDDHKQISCSLSTKRVTDRIQVSGSGTEFLDSTEVGYDTEACVVYADIDNSSGRWTFDINRRVIYSGTAQTTRGGLLTIVSYCH